MKFVVCRDEELMKLMGRSLEQGRTTKAVTFLEMVEMLRSETDTKIQND
jgi:hypothetical protein